MTGRHPGESLLALAAGGDAGVWQRLRVWLHVRECGECRLEMDRFRSARVELKDAALELPLGGEEWAKLAAEMSANIRLGLSVDRIPAGARIENAAFAEPAGWRAAVVLATLCVVLAGGILLRRTPSDASVARSLPVAEANEGGVGVHQGQMGFTLLTPENGQSVVLAGASGGARARFVDTETGQVTIHHVALED